MSATPVRTGRDLVRRTIARHRTAIVIGTVLLCVHQLAETSVAVVIGVLVDAGIAPRRVPGMLAAVAAVVLLLRRRRLLLLGGTIAVGVLLNAAVTGILSEAVDRYQARIIWLVPFLAALALLNAQDPAPPRAPPHA